MISLFTHFGNLVVVHIYCAGRDKLCRPTERVGSEVVPAQRYGVEPRQTGEQAFRQGGELIGFHI